MTIPTQLPSQPATRSRNGRKALVITLDRVEPAFYTGWTGDLQTADREAMVNLLTSAKFVVAELANESATRQAVTDALKAQAGEAMAGDQVIVYFSGHGAKLPDLNRDERGVRRDQPGIPRDGAWCLHDGMFVDDELIEALTLFKEGVRVVVISDSCFTGAIVGDASDDAQRRVGSLVSDKLRSKLAPVDIGERVYEVQKEFYDAILTRPPADPETAKAAVLILSACGRDELALIDADGESLFTANIVEAWSNGQFKGTYAELFENVEKAVTEQSSLQHPIMTAFGNQEPRLADEAAFGTQSSDSPSRGSRGTDVPMPMAAKGVGTSGYGDPS
jgi:metacaspase-1